MQLLRNREVLPLARKGSIVTLATKELMPGIKSALELLDYAPEESVTYTRNLLKSVVPKLEKYKSNSSLQKQILATFQTLLDNSNRITVSDDITPRSFHVPLKLLTPDEEVSLIAIWAELIEYIYLELRETDNYSRTPLGRMEIESRESTTSRQLVILLLEELQNQLSSIRVAGMDLHYHDFTEVSGLNDRVEAIEQTMEEAGASSISKTGTIQASQIVPIKSFLVEETDTTDSDTEKNSKKKVMAAKILKDLLYEQVDKEKVALLDHSYSFKWSFVPVLFAVAVLLVQTVGLEPVRTPLTIVSSIITICLWSGYKYAQKERSIELRLMFTMMLPTVSASSFITFIPFLYIITAIGGFFQGIMTREILAIVFLGVFLIFLLGIHVIFSLLPSMWGKERFKAIIKPVYSLEDQLMLCPDDFGYWRFSRIIEAAALRQRVVAEKTGWYIAVASSYIIVVGTGVGLGSSPAADLSYLAVLLVGMTLGAAHIYRVYLRQRNLAPYCLEKLGRGIECIKNHYAGLESIRMLRRTPKASLDYVQWLPQLIEVRRGLPELAKAIEYSSSPWRIIGFIGRSERLLGSSEVKPAISSAIQKTAKRIKESRISSLEIEELVQVPTFIDKVEIQTAFGEALESAEDVWTFIRAITATKKLLESQHVLDGIVAAIQIIPRGSHVVREIVNTSLIDKTVVRNAIAHALEISKHPWRMAKILQANSRIIRDHDIRSALLNRSSDIAIAITSCDVRDDISRIVDSAWAIIESLGEIPELLLEETIRSAAANFIRFHPDHALIIHELKNKPELTRNRGIRSAIIEKLRFSETKPNWEILKAIRNINELTEHNDIRKILNHWTRGVARFIRSSKRPDRVLEFIQGMSVFENDPDIQKEVYNAIVTSSKPNELIRASAGLPGILTSRPVTEAIATVLKRNDGQIKVVWAICHLPGFAELLRNNVINAALASAISRAAKPCKYFKPIQMAPKMLSFHEIRSALEGNLSEIASYIASTDNPLAVLERIQRTNFAINHPKIRKSIETQLGRIRQIIQSAENPLVIIGQICHVSQLTGNTCIMDAIQSKVELLAERVTESGFYSYEGLEAIGKWAFLSKDTTIIEAIDVITDELCDDLRSKDDCWRIIHQIQGIPQLMNNQKIFDAIASRREDIARTIETFEAPRAIINSISGVKALTEDTRIRWAVKFRGFDLDLLN
jgi:hypothetical protein